LFLFSTGISQTVPRFFLLAAAQQVIGILVTKTLTKYIEAAVSIKNILIAPHTYITNVVMPQHLSKNHFPFKQVLHCTWSQSYDREFQRQRNATNSTPRF
jgi:hypothetical protein